MLEHIERGNVNSSFLHPVPDLSKSSVLFMVASPQNYFNIVFFNMFFNYVQQFGVEHGLVLRKLYIGMAINKNSLQMLSCNRATL